VTLADGWWAEVPEAGAPAPSTFTPGKDSICSWFTPGAMTAIVAQARRDSGAQMDAFDGDGCRSDVGGRAQRDPPRGARLVHRRLPAAAGQRIRRGVLLLSRRSRARGCAGDERPRDQPLRGPGDRGRRPDAASDGLGPVARHNTPATWAEGPTPHVSRDSATTRLLAAACSGSRATAPGAVDTSGMWVSEDGVAHTVSLPKPQQLMTKRFRRALGQVHSALPVQVENPCSSCAGCRRCTPTSLVPRPSRCAGPVLRAAPGSRPPAPRCQQAGRAQEVRS
jgi:hypothetical protein